LAAASLAVMVWTSSRPIRTTLGEVEAIAEARFDGRSQMWDVVDGRFEQHFAADERERQRIERLSRPPVRLSPQFRAGCVVEEVLGDSVGMYCYYLRFDEAAVKAHVYALREGRFRIDGPLRAGPPYGVEHGSEDGIVTAAWGEQGFVYVLVYRGGHDLLDRVLVNRPILSLAPSPLIEQPLSKHIALPHAVGWRGLSAAWPRFTMQQRYRATRCLGPATHHVMVGLAPRPTAYHSLVRSNRRITLLSKSRKRGDRFFSSFTRCISVPMWGTG
jgi:hypothetical protein